MFVSRWVSAMLLCTMVLVGSASAAPQLPANPQPMVTTETSAEPSYDDISPAQEQAAWAEIRYNIAALRSAGTVAALPSAQSVALSFPLRLAQGLPEYESFDVAAFPDHDPSSGKILDYNGGTRTYDGHQGTDYALWPFKWQKVNGAEVQVIAAAAGTIVAHANATSADHNCAVNGSGSGGNYISLLHADGRVTLYAHMRYNSLTSKGIGQTVAEGEFLGTVASSGDSSGPHLHFEVRPSTGTLNWIDPYAGPNSQPTSLWINQRPYHDSGVNKVATHTATPIVNACQPDITNLQDSFTTPASVRFFTYYRDYQGILPSVQNIYRPDGSLFRTWTYNAADTSVFYSRVAFSWVIDFSNVPAGSWRYEVIFNGQVYQTFFNLDMPPMLALSSPNGSEQWNILHGYPVVWAGNFGGNVNISLYHNGVYTSMVADNTPDDGNYVWIPDLALPPGDGYSIRVASTLNPTIYDESNAPFTLLPTTLTNSVYLPILMK